MHVCWSQAHHLVAATVLVALFALANPPVAAATNVSGTISTNTTWTLANSPYVMTGNVTVAAGVTLTIEPSVLVQGNSNLRTLTVNGSLSAVGTASQQITFTSTTDTGPAQWLSMTFPSGAGTSTLKYVNIRNGGGGVGGDSSGMVVVNGGTITIEDSTISNSSVSGLAMNGGTNGTAATLTVRRTKIESNGFHLTSNGGRDQRHERPDRARGLGAVVPWVKFGCGPPCQVASHGARARVTRRRVCGGVSRACRS
jgi:hypothetical protein